jgi:DNA-binding CsgD family transcriptional regulator
MLRDVLKQPCVVIGDLVASRRAVDRMALHEQLLGALAAANTATAPADLLSPTVGDEFQGVFHSTGDALYATLLIRASMSDGHDVRFGIGLGEVMVLGETPTWFRQQDGPGWWAARDAIDYISAGRNVPRSLRTWVAEAPPAYARRDARRQGLWGDEGSPEVRALNAYLAMRDHAVSGMDDRDRRILRGLLAGHTLTAVADAEGITVSAVSQRVHRSGAAEVMFTESLLRSGG